MKNTHVFRWKIGPSYFSISSIYLLIKILLSFFLIRDVYLVKTLISINQNVFDETAIRDVHFKY